MSLPRFFIPKADDDSLVCLIGQERHHLVDVYRCQPGTVVELFDAQGNQYQAAVLSYDKKMVQLQILSKCDSKHDKPVQIFLAQGLIKSKSWDFLLQKAMELGLDGLFPMLTQHLGNGRNCAGKEERWRKIMISAAKQCGRNSIIDVTPIRTFAQILQDTQNFALRFMAHTESELPSLKNLLKQHQPTKQVLIFVGPEGGFSGDEVQQAKENGVHLFNMGHYILRAETAAISLVSNINFYWNS